MDNLEFKSCNLNEIQCKDCKWSCLLGAIKNSCVKFKRKPYVVYYENADCPKYEERKVNLNGR